MVEVYGAKYVSLHVRETNYAAFHLYRDTLHFAVHGTEAKYYADGENAYDMRKVITREMLGLPPRATAEHATPSAARSGGAGAKKSTGEASTGDLGHELLGDESVAGAVGDAGAAADIEPGAKDLEAVTSAVAKAAIARAPVVEELD
jgi:hypothetical protein